MPLYVRQIPAEVGTIIDPKSLPKDQVLFNPSFASPYISFRGVVQKKLEHVSFIVLFNKLSMKQTSITDVTKYLAPTVNSYQGIEDTRICWFENRLWFTATSTHASSRMANELLVGYFNKNLDSIERMSVVDVGSLPVKNVCPFVWKNTLHLFDAMKKSIYQVHEELDPNTGEWKRFKATTVRTLKACPGISDEKYKGSTSPVHLHGTTWGVVVHEVISTDKRDMQKLSYMHYWMEFDIDSGHITFMSTPFMIAKWGLEFVSGIFKDPNSHNVDLYLGLDDNVPVLAKTTLHDLRVGRRV